MIGEVCSHCAYNVRLLFLVCFVQTWSRVFIFICRPMGGVSKQPRPTPVLNRVNNGIVKHGVECGRIKRGTSHDVGWSSVGWMVGNYGKWTI